MNIFNLALNDSWNFYKIHFLSICQIFLLFLIPLNLVDLFLDLYGIDETRNYWIILLVSSLVYPLYQGSFIFYMATAVAEEWLPLKHHFSLARKLWLPLLITYTLVSLLVAVGLILLIVPGLFFAVRTAFAEFLCALNRQRPLEAMSQSWQLTQSYQWQLLGGLLLLYAAITVPVWALEISVRPQDHAGHIFDFFTGTVLSVVYPLTTIFCFRVLCLVLENAADTSPEP